MWCLAAFKGYLQLLSHWLPSQPWGVTLPVWSYGDWGSEIWNDFLVTTQNQAWQEGLLIWIHHSSTIPWKALSLSSTWRSWEQEWIERGRAQKHCLEVQWGHTAVRPAGHRTSRREQEDDWLSRPFSSSKPAQGSGKAGRWIWDPFWDCERPEAGWVNLSPPIPDTPSSELGSGQFPWPRGACLMSPKSTLVDSK